MYAIVIAITAQTGPLLSRDNQGIVRCCTRRNKKKHLEEHYLPLDVMFIVRVRLDVLDLTVADPTILSRSVRGEYGEESDPQKAKGTFNSGSIEFMRINKPQM